MADAVCPWWLGYFLANPLRRRLYDPEQVLGSFIKKNMQVMDVGCGMGFFSLPMAKLVGEKGRVICIDLQVQMIKALGKKASKAGLFTRIETRLCAKNSLQIADLAGKIDFVLAFAVMHEIPDVKNTLLEIYRVLKPGGQFLIAEPSHHVSKDHFALTVALAEESGFQVKEYLKIKSCAAVRLGV